MTAFRYCDFADGGGCLGAIRLRLPAANSNDFRPALLEHQKERQKLGAPDGHGMRDVKQGESVKTGARRRRGLMRKEQRGTGEKEHALPVSIRVNGFCSAVS